MAVPKVQLDEREEVLRWPQPASDVITPQDFVLPAGVATFDGTADEATIADDAVFDITNRLSVFLRCTNANASPSVEEFPISKYDSTGDERSWALGIAADDKLRLTLGDPSDGTLEGVWSSVSSIGDTSTIESLGFTFIDGVVQLYVDGEEVAGEVASGTIPTTIYSGTAVILLGASGGTTPGNFWEGTINDVMIYSGEANVLTPQQMKAIHNDTQRIFNHQTLVEWWPMEEMGGDLHYGVISGKNATISTASKAAYFGGNQSNVSYNGKNGYTPRQNKLPYSATTTGWSNNVVTFSESIADPFGGTSALRIIPADTTNAIHRVFNVAVGAASGDFVVVYAKTAVGTAQSVLGLQFTGGGSISIDTTDDSTGTPADCTLIQASSFTDAAGEVWKKYIVEFDSVSGGTLQIAALTATSESPDTAYTPANDTDGLDIYIALVDDPLTEPFPTTGTEEDEKVDVPALSLATGDNTTGDAVINSTLTPIIPQNKSLLPDIVAGLTIANFTRNNCLRFPKEASELVPEDFSATPTVDFDIEGPDKSILLTGNITGLTLSATNAGYYSLVVLQDATGSRTVTLTTTVNGTAPTVDSTADTPTLLPFYFDGTNWFWVPRL